MCFTSLNLDLIYSALLLCLIKKAIFGMPNFGLNQRNLALNH